MSVTTKNVPMNGPVLKDKVMQFMSLGKKNFVVGNEWLYHIKDRHATVFKLVCAESGQVLKSVIEKWL